MNPFKFSSYYILIFLILDFLNFSDLYKDLGLKAYIFIGFMLLLNLFNSRIFQITFSRQAIIPLNQKKITLLTGAVLFLLNFSATSKIPLIELITGGDMDYKNYNYLPFIFPLSISFAVLISVTSFYNYLFFKKRKEVIIGTIFLILQILYLARGVFIISVFTIIMFVLAKKKFNLSSKIKIASISFIIFIGFGFLGNLRTSNDDYDNSKQLFLEISGANQNFKKSGLPEEFLWGYIYLVSPIYNLSESLKSRTTNKDSWLTLISQNFFPQSLQNLINKRIEKKDKTNLVADYFNVSTEFNLPFQQKRFLGLFFYLFLKYSIYWFLIFNTAKPYRFILNCFFSSVFFFSWFSNMFILDVVFIPIIMLILYSRRRPVLVKHSL